MRISDWSSDVCSSDLSLMIYGRVATGYRPGRSNSFNSDPTIQRAADADTTTNYELGVKGSALSNMLSFDLSLYQIDWKKIQITLISASNGLAYTANAAKARIDRKSTRLNSSH